MNDPCLFPEVLSTLLARRHLTDAQMRGCMLEMISGRWGEAESAACLIALRMKGETAAEVATAARVLREHMVRWDPGRPQVLDTCGTGGDGTRTFNISTAAAFAAAAAGVYVVKHGNRAVSSRSGSADVLAALGLPVDGDGEQARQCLDRAGLAFCFAPRFHPALKQLAALRRRLGVSTLFNCLGPLANPAGACYQLLGVGRPELLDLMAGALARLGTTHALVVCGQDGLDEVTLSAPTSVREVRGERITTWEWTAADFELEPCFLEDLQAENAEASAAIIGRVLQGYDGPPARIVLANAAAALFAADKVASVREGVRLARQAISSGRARAILDMLKTA